MYKFRGLGLCWDDADWTSFCSPLDSGDDDLVASMSPNWGKMWKNCRRDLLDTLHSQHQAGAATGRFAAIRHGEVIANLGESSQAGLASHFGPRTRTVGDIVRKVVMWLYTTFGNKSNSVIVSVLSVLIFLLFIQFLQHLVFWRQIFLRAKLPDVSCKPLSSVIVVEGCVWDIVFGGSLLKTLWSVEVRKERCRNKLVSRVMLATADARLLDFYFPLHDAPWICHRKEPLQCFFPSSLDSEQHEDGPFTCKALVTVVFFFFYRRSFYFSECMAGKDSGEWSKDVDGHRRVKEWNLAVPCDQAALRGPLKDTLSIVLIHSTTNEHLCISFSCPCNW